MGYIILGVAATCLFIKLPGHAALLWGQDQPELQVQFSAGAGGTWMGDTTTRSCR